MTMTVARSVEVAPSSPFLTSEQAVRAPAPPDAFRLHWFAADPALVTADSAVPEPAAALVGRHVPDGVRVPDGMVALPVHPRRVDGLRARAGVADLLAAGRLRDLGVSGPEWHTTVAQDTVYRADAMLTFTLAASRDRMRRGLDLNRLLADGLGDELAAAHPGFGIARDLAWLSVDQADGMTVTARENPAGPRDLVRCVAGLTAGHDTGRPGRPPSLLAALIGGLALRSGRALPDVAREWFGRYLRAVAGPVMWLYSAHGIVLDANQRDILLVLNPGGWPVGARYRDPQRYHVVTARAQRLPRPLHADLPDGRAYARLNRHLAADNIRSLMDAFHLQRLADERLLRGDLHAFLAGTALGDVA